MADLLRALLRANLDETARDKRLVQLLLVTNEARDLSYDYIYICIYIHIYSHKIYIYVDISVYGYGYTIYV